MTTQIADLVGLTEIAEMYGVTKNVASGWTRKHTFPRPVHTLRMGPMWDRKQVRSWRATDPALEHEYHVSCLHCGADEDSSAIAWGTIIQDPAGEVTKIGLRLKCAACGETTFVTLSPSHIMRGMSVKITKEDA
jgi:predicted DNA-binding transcriptional regulator AlpA